MEIAIIGLPQSGKSTLLDALTGGRTESATHSGARQEVLAGVTKLADPRLDRVAQIFKPDKVVPGEIRYLAVPAGSAIEGDGVGIGGQSLNLLQGADALLLVARSFDDPSVPHVAGSVDPYRDMANLEAELAFSDLSILERRMERLEANLKGASGRQRDVLMREGATLRRLREGLEKDIPVREQQVPPEETDILANYQLLTSKPLLIALNVGEVELSGLAGVEEEVRHSLGQKRGVGATALCAKLEMELAQLEPKDEREFRQSMGLAESGVDRMVRSSFELLSLVSFFTHVSLEVRAWTVAADTPAVKAAGKIHSDMERGFIRAEVMAFDDLDRCGSVAQCRREGHLRLEGKSYRVQDGDVITFLFNV